MDWLRLFEKIAHFRSSLNITTLYDCIGITTLSKRVHYDLSSFKKVYLAIGFDKRCVKNEGMKINWTKDNKMSFIIITVILLGNPSLASLWSSKGGMFSIVITVDSEALYLLATYIIK